ncbi:MAG: tetratricopeptide repeat protein [Candidatus Obscuribacterales bacterium]|nr:tetratricopeptide repeat protein [Candidatus Obscuribacterales bacterium]
MRQLNRQMLIALSASILMCACSSHVQTPQGLSTVPMDNGSKVADASNAGSGEKFDAVTDEIISRETLKAWRVALRHDKEKDLPEAEIQKLKVGDEEESMQSLKKLEATYPTASFIKTMMGQVKQHFGKKKEAADYFEEASLLNRRDPVALFKAAEMRRENGQTEKALDFYKQIVRIQDDFPGAKVGMARCLLADKATEDEGRKMLESIVAQHPEDADAKAALDASSSKK